MKQTVFVIVLLVLSIGIPILAESNDSLSTESENPVLQNQELKLPWYKNMNYTLAYNNDSSLLTSGSSSKDTLKGKGIPFWMKLDYGIGYSGGLCWTGEDLARSFEASPIAGPFILPMYFVAHLYYLNSIEVSATYPLKKGKGIEVGMGYGWATGIGFRLIPVWVGYSIYSGKRSILRMAYVYSYSHEFYFRGNGFRFSCIFPVNRNFSFRLDIGKVWYKGKKTGDNISLYLNGIGFIIGYNFTPKGGLK